jgi:hemerythrin-like domain-containing protein
MVDQGSPNQLADTRLLQAVHTTFRLMTTRLVDATERLEPSVLKPVIGQRWSFYSAVLHHHHHNEDDSAFPALLALRPDLDALVQELEDDHRRLIPAMQAVNSAISVFEKDLTTANQELLHAAVVAVRDSFFPHLDLEDEQILPAFAQSISPKDWDRMDNEALKSIPRQYLPMAVGALDEVMRGLPQKERPPPPPPPIRLMLALSWRKKWTAWVKPLLVS